MLTLAIRRLLGSVDPPASSVLGLTRGLWFSLFALAMALAADVATTGLFVAANGSSEANPIAAFFLRSGIPALALAKFVGLIAAYVAGCLIVLDGTTRYIFRYTLLLYTLAAIFVIVSLSNLMTAFIGADLFHFVWGVFYP